MPTDNIIVLDHFFNFDNLLVAYYFGPPCRLYTQLDFEIHSENVYGFSCYVILDLKATSRCSGRVGLPSAVQNHVDHVDAGYINKTSVGLRRTVKEGRVFFS